MKNRMEAIKQKGFAMGPAERQMIDYEKPTADFSKIKVGVKTLEDALVENVGSYKKVNGQLADKCTVLRAINELDYKKICKYILDYKYNSIASAPCLQTNLCIYSLLGK